MSRRSVVAVIGNAHVEMDSEAWILARDTGRALVDQGFRVAGGGLGGVMEASFQGARSSCRYREGDTIAILPGFDPSAANIYADIIIPTGLDIGRNLLVANQDGVIAVGGGSGTLCELAYAWQLRRPLVALDTEGWSGKLKGCSLDERVRLPDGSEDHIHTARSGSEAVRMMAELLPQYTSRFPGRR